MPRARRRRPEVRRRPWGDRSFPKPAPPSVGAREAWTDTEAWLRLLRETGAIVRIDGGSGLWIVTDSNGVERRISAETDAESRLERSILGAAR